MLLKAIREHSVPATAPQRAAAHEPIVVRMDPVLADLVPAFLQNRRNDVIAMHAALADGDFDTVSRLGHSMRGSGGGYGFQVITDIGLALEQAAEVSDGVASRRCLGELTSFLDRVKVV